jgi:hypothetical protein
MDRRHLESGDRWRKSSGVGRTHPSDLFTKETALSHFGAGTASGRSSGNQAPIGHASLADIAGGVFSQDDIDVSVGGANCFVRDLGHFLHKVAFFIVAESDFEIALDEWHFESPLLEACFRVVLFRRVTEA